MEQVESRKYDFDRVVRLVISIITIVVLVYVINYLTPVLWPFVLGFILAYILEPIVEWIQRVTHLRKRIVPVVITLVLVIALLVGAFWLLIPYLVDEFTSMGHMLTAYARSSFNIPYVPSVIHDYIREYLDIDHPRKRYCH